LDFACGTGRITNLLENFAEASYGIDISANMIEQAKKKCIRTKFFVGDFTQQSFSEKNFDLVTSFRFFGNAEDEIRTSALRSISGMLADNGYFIFNDHRNPWTILNALKKLVGDDEMLDLHYWKLKKLLKESGFKIVHIYGIGFWVIRSKLMKYLFSDLGKTLDRITRLNFLGAFCPDFIVIAQKGPDSGKIKK
jgi:ubiquinone/menaquinone biosynthesis C-methylase UbiE